MFFWYAKDNWLGGEEGRGRRRKREEEGEVRSKE
jgi:hypothetical protein